MVATIRPLRTLLQGAAFCALLLSGSLVFSDAPKHDVIGVAAEQLTPEYWIARAKAVDATVLDADAIAAQNERLRAGDPSVNTLEKLPAAVEAAQVRAGIEGLSRRPAGPLFGSDGKPLEERAWRALERSLALDAVPARAEPRYGLVVRRAPLRAFPTLERVFNAPGDTNIDRFQESALFPGTPVAALHESRDGEWWFVVSPLYEAWVEKRHVALGARDTVLGYARKAPYLVVTGASVRTVYTPDAPDLSELQLEMGVRVPLLADWPGDRPVNGQHPYTNHVVELPRRRDDGTLAFAPALVPRTADVATDYLPLTRANLLRQGFKFLGERYGWGHDYNARDCSGFVSEVYRSFGVTLPRNTKDQAVSPAYARIGFDAGMSRDERIAVLRDLDVGDLVYIPGHVMMVIGHVDGEPYVIHDTTGIGYRDPGSGAYRRVVLNGVSVTPLLPLHAGEDARTIDRITSVQRIRPVAAAGAR